MEEIIIRYFGKYNTDGFYEAFYNTEVWNINDIPNENCIELTKEQWEQALCEECVVINGKHSLHVKSEEEIKEITLQGIRKKRDLLLKDSDWTQLKDSPLNDQQTLAWASYRQTLRDLPQTVDINNIVFPEKPL